MLDIQLIRRDPDAVRAALSRRGPDAAAGVDRLLELDQRWRAATTELEELRAEQNRASKGRKGPPTPEEREHSALLVDGISRSTNDQVLVAQELVRAIQRLEDGKGTDEDLETILDVGDNIVGRAFCALGDAVPVPIQSAIKYFRDEIVQHQKEGGCPFDPAASTLWAGRK